MATIAHRVFFNILGQTAEVSERIGKRHQADIFNPWNVSDFQKYLHAIGIPPGSATALPRLLSAMEHAGLFLNAGWTPNYPLLGQRYITQGGLSKQHQGNLWLAEALGPELVIQSYRIVTLSISSGEGPTGSALVLDDSHILTNKHVLKGLADPSNVVIGPDAGNRIPGKFRPHAHVELDVAVLELLEMPDGLSLPSLKGMVFRDPAWADEVYLLGYPRVPWMVGTDIMLQRGEVVNPILLQRGKVVNPLAAAPPVRDDDTEKEGIVPNRTKMFLYSAIARPGNSGGPIIASDGRVIGIVVEDSMNTQSSDPSRRAGEEETDEPDAAPFYRGIPASEIVRALKDLGLDHLVVFEDPTSL